MVYLADQIARVTATGKGKGDTKEVRSVGSAFAIADGLVLTARHVVCAEEFSTGVAESIVLDFPGGRHPPFAAVPLIDPLCGQTKATHDDDWIVLVAAEATQRMVPLPWGVLDADGVGADFQARTHGRAFAGGGYPVGKQHLWSLLRGQLLGVEMDAGVTFLSVNVEASFQTSPSGFSGGPVLVDGTAVGMVVWAAITKSRIMGDPLAGGHLRARPLPDILVAFRARVKTLGISLPTSVPGPRLLGHPDAAPEANLILAAAAAAVTAEPDPIIEEAARSAYDTVRLDMPLRYQDYAFVLAIQRLVCFVRPQTGEGLLDRFLNELATRAPGNAGLAPLLAARIIAPTHLAPPSAVTGIALDLRWKDGRSTVSVQLYEKRADGYWVGENHAETPIAPVEDLLEACGALLASWAERLLSMSLPIEFVTPFELASVPFDDVRVPSRFGPQAVGTLVPVTVRIRWDEPIEVDPATASARKAALKGLRTPLALGPPLEHIPTNDNDVPAALRLQCERSNPKRWWTWLRPRPVLVVALDRPVRIDKGCAGYAAFCAGVPIVAWDRTAARDVAAPFAASGQTIGDAVYLHRSASENTTITVVYNLPGEPLPQADLLTNPTTLF